MQLAPSGGQIWNQYASGASAGKIGNQCKSRHLVAKLQPIEEVSLKSISNYSSWEIYSSYGLNTLGPLCLWHCLASQDALELMLFTYWLTHWLMVSIDLTDVTLVSDDTFRRLGTWVTHDHLSSVIESNLTDVTLVSDDT